MTLEELKDGANLPQYFFNIEGVLEMTRRSPFTGNWHKANLQVTRDQLTSWFNGDLIQDAMPHLSADEREFLITGITPQEWDEAFSEEKEA